MARDTTFPPATYREGYPMLDAAAMRNALAQDRRFCRFTFQRVVLLGPVNCWNAGILEVSPPGTVSSFDVAWAFSGPGFVGAYRSQLEVGERKINDCSSRPFFRCPDCNHPRDRLFCRRSWACGPCHKLRNRSNLLSYDTRQAEKDVARRNELHDLTMRGRPKGMHASTYNRHLKELKSLEGRRRPYRLASRAMRTLVTAEWCSFDALDVEDLHYLERASYAPRIFRRAELPGD